MDLGVDPKMPILKRNRLSTGIPDLDLILEGGYRNPGNLMLVGPSGLEKAAFAYHFASAAKGEKAFIVCGNSSPKDIVNKAGTMGIDLTKVHFIDCYSATLGKTKPQEGENITIVDGPSALNDISLALNEAIRASSGKRMRVVFDTLSTFVLYNSKDSMRKFLSVIEGRLKTANATTLFLIDEGVHERAMLSLMETGMDETFKLADKGGNFMLDVPDVSMDLPIRVGPSGINLL
jgi:KaiC/GvpD/RAD55 family RecA-like ATPase